jgi:hypothetical protein
MNQTIQADDRGSLVLPAGAVPPGTRFTVEVLGEDVILRRESSQAERWWASTTPEQRVAWLREWMASLPPGTALPLEATRRDSMYD